MGIAAPWVVSAMASLTLIGMAFAQHNLIRSSVAKPAGLSHRGGVLRAVFYHRSPMIALHSLRWRPRNTPGRDLVGPGSGRTGARVPGFVPEEGPPSCQTFPIPTDPGAYKLEIVLPGEAHAEEFFPPDSTMIKSAAFTFSSCGIHHPASPRPLSLLVAGIVLLAPSSYDIMCAWAG